MTPKSNYIFTFSCPNNWGGYNSDKNYTTIRLFQPIGQFSKIFILGHQDGLHLICESQHFFVTDEYPLDWYINSVKKAA